MNHRPTSRKSSHHLNSAPSMASSTTSISAPVSPAGGSGIGQSGVNRNDQIIHRIYLKTVGVLVDGRLTHGQGRENERRKDKWFNIIIPDVDIHKSDLHIYKSISTYPSDGIIPPLLVAFILDTSDIPSNQALLWNRPSGRSTLDATMIGKGKGKEKEGRSGIVLERWTFQASTASSSTSESQTAPHTAYRMGIIHFRALYALLRMLPAYNLHRRLRRANNGLKLGLKLWAPEGYPNSEAGLREAWEVMEQDLVGLDTGLTSLVSSEIEPDLENKSYDFPSLELFGNEYNLCVDYRPEVDIHVEDLESVLSEKFVDMEEDWFTPTVARHRLNERSLPSSVASSNPPSRRVATPTAIPYSNPAPIPQRQGPASIGSFQSAHAQQGLLPGSRNRQASSQSQKEPVSERWGQIGEGLPFATGNQGPSPGTSGAAVAARRLSGHSIHPFTSASPSTSNLRGSPSYAQGPSPTLAPRPSIAHSSSIGRTSSFLSQSGRSFTHAQLAHMYTGSTSPPVTGAMSREHLPLGPTSQPPLVSPTSLSFSKQPLPRTSSARQPSYTGQSPFIPSSLERDNSMPPPSSIGHGSVPKRYPTALSTSQGQAQRRLSSYGSSAAEGASVGGSHGNSQNLLRRSSTRMSTESGLRHSLEKEEQVNVPDNDDIQSFLKTLDTLPQPPSLAAQASRARIPSASSSLSNTSIPQQSPTLIQSNIRAPVTRAQVDDAVRRMTGSFAITTKALEGSSVMPRTTSPGSGPKPSVGLLSASRPLTAPRRVSPASLAHGPSEGITPGSGSVKRNSPLSGAPFQPPPPPVDSDKAAQTALPPSPPPPAPTRSKSAARSLPAGPGPVSDPSILPHPRSGFLSPQPTGSGSRTEGRPSSQRRGPVLLRGGFEGRSQSTAHQRLSTSPSRSPIRDYPRLGTVSGFALPRSGSTSISAGTGQGESQAEAELIGWRRYRSEQRIANRVGNHEKEVEGMRRQSAGAGDVLEDQRGQGQGQGGLTAPSSLGHSRSRGREGDPGEDFGRD